ncbi:MAG: hypothetical protein U0R28_01650 [Candidatus Nanopelagicales bacterium]
MTVEEPGTQAPEELRRWRIAVIVLALLSLTLLITTIALRVRSDAAVRERNEAVARANAATAEAGQQQRRNDELLTQLSTSNERLAELTGQVPGLGAADANVAQQVAAQRAAKKALAKAQAQLRNAQTCAAGALLALSQVHSGPDVESGSDEAAATLESVLPACRAGLE